MRGEEVVGRGSGFAATVAVCDTFFASGTGILKCTARGRLVVFYGASASATYAHAHAHTHVACARITTIAAAAGRRETQVSAL